jgi:thymidine kinase
MTDEGRDRNGRIEVVCGCMFSGKSQILISRVQNARYRQERVIVFKHASDTRFDPTSVVTHDRRRLAAVPIERADELLARSADADVIAVDEAQFFDAELPAVCRQLAAAGKDVIVVGLDRDSWGLPFGPMPELIAIADETTRTTAQCAVCGRPAEFTQRITPIGETMVGGEEAYQPRCGQCFSPPPAALRR